MSLKKLPVKWIFWFLINVAIGIGLLGMLLSKTNPEPSHINEHLSEIHGQLTSLQQVIKTSTEKTDLSAINQDVNKLATLINEMKGKDDSQLNKLVLESRTQLAEKLDAMNTVISSLDKKQHPVQYLPVSALPFKIISIDSIQQVSVASVAYDYKTIPLEKSDALAGWTVLSIDFGKQSIELENNNKEHVLVALEGAEQHA